MRLEVIHVCASTRRGSAGPARKGGRAGQRPRIGILCCIESGSPGSAVAAATALCQKANPLSAFSRLNRRSLGVIGENPMVRKPGFSLVELVIVVVIIGTITAIVVPRISRAARGAADAALRANLATLRGAIDMYAAEHGGTLPGANGLKTMFKKQMTKMTDENGNDGKTQGVHIFGPYLRSGLPGISAGPNIGASDVLMTTTTPIQNAVDDAKVMQGWVYNYETGEIVANTDDLDDRGVGYDTY